MAATSSTLSSENEVKDHPHQVFETPGPRGAYEARQVKDAGFYARIDMPGVPPNGVKLIKYGEKRTVTFSGKAPMFWPGHDSSDRVYGGYVVLDRDPNEIQVEMTVKNGCLRLFFPGAEGTLHFLGTSKRALNVEDSQEEDTSLVYEDSNGALATRALVSLAESSMTHINPYLMQGVEGVYESRVLEREARDSLYIRMDMPGLEEKLCTVGMLSEDNPDDCVVYGGEGEKEDEYDVGGRSYFSSFHLQCGCCKVVGVKHKMKDGVLRILIRKMQHVDSGSSIRRRRRRR